MNQLKAFFEKVAGNPELKNKLDVVNQMPEEQRMEAAIALAKGVGISLTAKDFAPPTDEMSEDELAAVAGGTAGDGISAQANMQSGDQDPNELWYVLCAITGSGYSPYFDARVDLNPDCTIKCISPGN